MIKQIYYLRNEVSYDEIQPCQIGILIFIHCQRGGLLDKTLGFCARRPGVRIPGGGCILVKNHSG